MWTISGDLLPYIGVASVAKWSKAMQTMSLLFFLFVCLFEQTSLKLIA